MSRKTVRSPHLARTSLAAPAAPLNIDSILAATVALGVVAKATDLDTRVAAWLEQQRRLHDEQGGIMRDAVAADGFSAHDMYEMIAMLHDIVETLFDEDDDQAGPA